MTATAIAAAESPDVAGPRTTVRSTLAVSLLAALVPALAGLAFLGRYGWDLLDTLAEHIDGWYARALEAADPNA